MAERGIIFKSDFVSVPSKSWFDMSYDNIFSANFGELVPTTCMECMASDLLHCKSDSFTRLAPMLAPSFGKVNQFSYHFYVRNRDIWTHWDSFITNNNQKQSWQSAIGSTFTPPVMPYIDIRQVLYSDLLFNDFAGNLSDLVLWSIANGTLSNTKLLKAQSTTVDIMHLMLWVDSNGVKYSTLYDSQWLDNVNHKGFIISFIPNKEEYDSKHTITRSGITNPTNYRYNPFCDGSLFDYLGVDLSGLYEEQLDALVDWNLDAQAKGIDAAFTLNGNYSGATQNDTGIPFDCNLNQFAKSHAIVGFTVYESSTKYYTASPFNRYFLMNSTDSYGDGPATVKPFNRSEESAKISALPLRAYYFVYSEYFRDQNYIDVNPCVDFTRDGNDLIILSSYTSEDLYQYLTLKVKSWEHDPYTSALPAPQRGNAVRYLPDSKLQFGEQVTTSNTNLKSGAAYLYVNDDGVSAVGSTAVPSSASSATSIREVVADLSAATIENFRFANATQRYLEKVARSGSRYYEYMLAVFGADISDAKLSRPIYLGGDKTPIQVSEVLQTSASQMSDDQPLGQMAGRAIAVGNDDYLEYVVPDNGFFIELSCIIPRVSYMQGLKSMFTRKVFLDYPLPDFAQLGEEPVKQQELYYSGDDTKDDTTFGFQSRYYQFKYNRDEVHGSFKNSLNYWHFGRKFESAPVNGKEFIEVNPDYRQFAVTSKNYEHVYCHMYHDIQVQRCLPIFGVPSI